MRKLTTTNLEIAVWIAKLGSFTAAAERMHTCEPAVSARVKELEGTLCGSVALAVKPPAGLCWAL